MDENCFGGEMPATTRGALLNFLNAGTFNTSRTRDTLALALSSAAFQWY
jgi:hypothetical protein